MEDRPPLVNLPGMGIRAQLVGWVLHDGVWWAALSRLDLKPLSGYTKQGHDPFYETSFYALSSQVEPMPGVDYSRVPRRTA